MDVKTHSRKVTVVLYEKTFKTPLEQMPAPLVPAVKPDGVTYSKPLNRTGEVGFFGTNEKVIVVLHQNISMYFQFKPLCHPAHNLEKLTAISFVIKNFSLFVPAG